MMRPNWGTFDLAMVMMRLSPRVFNSATMRLSPRVFNPVVIISCTQP